MVNQLKILFETFFLQNDPLDFWKEVRTSPQKRCHQTVRKLFAQGLKMPFHLKLLSNQVFIPNWLLRLLEWLFYTPAEKLSTKRKKIRSKSDIDMKSTILSKKLFSSEAGYVTLGQFCLLCRSFSARSQKHFCSKSEKDRAKITILEKDSSSIRPPRCLEGSFCKHAGNVRQKILK